MNSTLPFFKANGVDTKLDQVISGVNYRPEFHYGSGINVITGGVAGTAIKPFNVKPITTNKSKEAFVLIQNENDFSMELEVNVSGKYNIEGVNVSASTSYLKQIEYTASSITLVAKYFAECTENETADNYYLTEQASELIKEPEKFREVYGDYFIAGGLKGSRFVAVYVCKAHTETNLDSFKGDLGVDIPDVFSAAGSTALTNAARSNGVDLTCSIEMLGNNTNYPPIKKYTPEAINEALGWFKTNNTSGCILSAELRHYSTVSNSYPRTIEIPPYAFVELRMLCLALWDLRSVYDSLPPYYKNMYKQSFEMLNESIVASQTVLATDSGLQAAFRKQVDDLLSEFKVVLSRQDFYLAVQEKIYKEPKAGDQIEESANGPHRWTYGTTQYDAGNAVVIQTQSLSYKAVGHGVGYKYKQAEYNNPNTIIVGWEVICHWNDGSGGYWWKNQEQVLLNNQMELMFKSFWGRGFSFSVNVYFVDAADYQFKDIKGIQEARKPTQKTLPKILPRRVTPGNKPVAFNPITVQPGEQIIFDPADSAYVFILTCEAGDRKFQYIIVDAVTGELIGFDNNWGYSKNGVSPQRNGFWITNVGHNPFTLHWRIAGVIPDENVQVTPVSTP